jgi:hypothetical protein
VTVSASRILSDDVLCGVATPTSTRPLAVLID